MGKIKTFKAVGPNPNVSFSNIPDARSAGIVEGAVSRAAEAFGKKADQYFTQKQRQKDSADILSAEKNRLEFINKLKGVTFDEANQTYDVDTFKKELSVFNDETRQGLSDKAREIYDQKSGTRDELLLNKLFYENQAQERKNSREKLASDYMELYEKMSSQSIEDMQMTKATADEGLLAGVAANTFTDLEAKEMFKKAAKSTVKNFVDVNTVFATTDLNEVKNATRKIEAFVAADPTGYFKENPAAAEQVLATARERSFTATNRIISNNERQERRFEKQLAETQVKNYKGMISALNTIDVQGPNLEERDDPFADIETKSELYKEANNLYRQNQITETQLNKILNHNSLLAKSKDTVILSDLYDDPESAAQALENIDTPSIRKQALEFLQKEIPGTFSDSYKEYKFNKAGVSKEDYFSSIVPIYDEFSEIVAENKDFNFTEEDLQALIIFSKKKDPSFRDIKEFRRDYMRKTGVTGVEQTRVRLNTLKGLLGKKLRERNQAR